MSDARLAIRSAEEANAAVHAPQRLQEAQILLQQAQTKLGVGAYGEAKRLALDARDLAIQAREQSLTTGHP